MEFEECARIGGSKNEQERHFCGGERVEGKKMRFLGEMRGGIEN